MSAWAWGNRFSRGPTRSERS